MLQTALILLALAFILFWKSVPVAAGTTERKYNAFDLPSTHFFKGLCAMIVVLVHIPEQYSNPLQDAVGSFAFIAVTFFFFVSAYGMQYSLEHRPDYLSGFWRKRLIGLLVPMFLVNIISSIYCNINPSDFADRWPSLVRLNSYVSVLLQYCLLFYIVEVCARKFGFSQKVADRILSATVVASSLFIYFSSDGGHIIGWPYERLGLVYGLIAYRHRQTLISWMERQSVKKLAVSCVIGAIAGAAYLKFKQEYFFGEYLLKVFLGFSVLCVIFLLSSWRRFGNAPGKALADISYEIYLSHTVSMFFIAYFFPRLGSGWFILAVFALTLTISALVRATSDAISRWINKLLDKPRKA